MIITLILTFSLIYYSICHPDILLVSGNSFSLQRFSLFFYFYRVSMLVCTMYICHIYRKKRRWKDIVQRWKTVALTLCKVNLTFSTLDTDAVSMLWNYENPTLDFVSFSTSNQRYLNGDPQYLYNVDTSLKCWQGR